MKNLIDEIHKLDEYEYKVSDDFSKKVMKKIKRGKTSNKVSYVISLASVGIVACLAVVAFNNSNIKTNFMVQESANKAETSKYDFAYNDTAPNRVNSNVNDLTNEAIIEPEKESSLKTENALQIADALVSDKLDNVYTQIEDILNKAEYVFKITAEGFEVKATKETIEDLLKDYTDIIIEEKNDYILIKEK